MVSADTMLLGFVPQHQPTMQSIFMSNVIDYGLFQILQSTNRYYIYFNGTALT